jgi:hypothetical protein
MTFLCPVGTYLTATGCTPCASGTYSNSVGATSAAVCLPCLAGTYSSLGASLCTTCITGTDSAAGASFCVNTGVTCGSTQCAGNDIPGTALVVANDVACAHYCRTTAGCSAFTVEIDNRCWLKYDDALCLVNGGFRAWAPLYCTLCTPGTYATLGATNCSRCPSGMYSLTGASSCELSLNENSCSVAVEVNGGGFETPLLATDTFSVVNLPAWGNGLALLGNGAAFCEFAAARYRCAPSPPEGKQFFIGQVAAGSINLYQTITAPSAATFLRLSFFFAKRNYGTYAIGALSVSTFINGSLVDTFVPPEVYSWTRRDITVPLPSSAVQLRVVVTNSANDDQTVFLDKFTAHAEVPCAQAFPLWLIVLISCICSIAFLAGFTYAFRAARASQWCPIAKTALHVRAPLYTLPVATELPVRSPQSCEVVGGGFFRELVDVDHEANAVAMFGPWPTECQACDAVLRVGNRVRIDGIGSALCRKCGCEALRNNPCTPFNGTSATNLDAVAALCESGRHAAPEAPSLSFKEVRGVRDAMEIDAHNAPARWHMDKCPFCRAPLLLPAELRNCGGPSVCHRCTHRVCIRCNATFAEAVVPPQPGKAQQTHESITCAMVASLREAARKVPFTPQQMAAIGVKPCPNCRTLVQRISGCPAMVCGKDYHAVNDVKALGCGARFCWDCLGTMPHGRSNIVHNAACPSA